jgi:hypothetical protein
MPSAKFTFELPLDAPSEVLRKEHIDFGQMMGRGGKVFGEGRVERILFLRLD